MYLYFCFRFIKEQNYKIFIINEIRKIMKKLFIILLAVLPLFTMAQKPKNKIETKLYGFIKGDMVYATNGVYSWANTNNNYLSAPQFASDDENSALGFTAQHTRFGLKVSKGGEIKVGGKIEMDFYGGAFDANGKPRIRQAYAYMKKGNFELRVGQQWDIFSPVNATTNNTNGNMWYAGNRGFRRAQIQVRYQFLENSLLQLSLGESSKEGAGLGIDNKSALPMIQGRLSTKVLKKYTVGAYFAYASFSPDPDDTDLDFNASGFGVDLSLPICKYLAVKGEVNYGTNLNNANLFNIAGSGAKDNDRESLGIWFNATSKISEHFSFVLGYGMDKNNTDNLVDGFVENNTAIYGDFIFPIANGFSLAAEVESIKTSFKNADSNSAIVFNLSGKITF